MTAAAHPRESIEAQDPRTTELYGEGVSRLAPWCDGISPEWLALHLWPHAEHGGESVYRAAVEAAAGRLAALHREQLRVAQRPGGGAVLGRYATRRPREPVRPYSTLLRSREPMAASCDCPDYLSNSLGLCKHVLAVLASLARRKRLPRDAPSGVQLVWLPRKPIEGTGDWLDRIRLVGGPVPAEPLWSELRGQLAPQDDGFALAGQRGDPAARLGLVRALERVAVALPAAQVDPAILALCRQEGELLAPALALAPLRDAYEPFLDGFARALYPYQRDGLARFLATGRLLLADDMGLGKTTQTIAAAHVLWNAGRVRRGLVIMPASLKAQWLREWQASSPAPVAMVDGSAAERAAAYQGMDRGFLLANYEQLLRDLDIVQAWSPDLVVLDEAQRIKNWQTRTANEVKRLEAPFRLVLTGTPFENRLAELDSVLEWLDRRPLQPHWRLAPLHESRAHRSGRPTGMRQLDVLRERLGPVMLRRVRAEVLTQLPARTDTRIDVPLEPAQREEHDARNPGIAQLLRILKRRPLTPVEFTRLMALFVQQRIATNGYAQLHFDEIWPGLAGARPEPALLRSLASPKLAELQELVRQIAIEQGRKIVIFSQWLRALELGHWACGELLERAGLRAAFFTGQVSQRRRSENVVQFHDDPATRVLFATDAGGVGLNLQRAATCCIHFDLPWNPAVFEQRVGRIYRLGQEHPIDVYSLVGVACIESHIAALLRDKRAAFSALFDGTGDEITFSDNRSFLGQMAALVAPEAVASEPVEDDESLDEIVAPAPEPAANPGPIEQTGALESGRSDPGPSVPQPPGSARDERPSGERVASGAELAPLGEGLAPLRGALAALRIESLPDGGLRLEAPPAAAGLLAELFRGLAAALQPRE